MALCDSVISTVDITEARNAMIKAVEELLPHATQMIPDANAELHFEDDKQRAIEAKLKSMLHIDFVSDPLPHIENEEQDTKNEEALLHLLSELKELKSARTWRQSIRGTFYTVSKQQRKVRDDYDRHLLYARREFQKVMRVFQSLKRDLERLNDD